MLCRNHVPGRPEIVIIGAGFGGLRAARKLKRANANITVIDKRNHYLFQPLLYQVATGALSAADIASPIRSELRDCKNTAVLLDEVVNVDTKARRVFTKENVLKYDYLIVATGTQKSYFAHSDWADFAPGLKTAEDAIELRAKTLKSFEAAEQEVDPARRERLMTFVVVGGGPTGVELAGAISELSRTSIHRDFRCIDPTQVKIYLVEMGPNILGGFSPFLQDKAMVTLKKLKVEVLTGTKVDEINENGVRISEGFLESHNVIWTAGVGATNAGKWLNVPTNRRGQIAVNSNLTIPGLENIFVIGDLAYFEDKNGAPLPGLAPVAIQQGKYVAKLLSAKVAGKRYPKPFHYSDKGMMATIGYSKAVADLRGLKMWGTIGWLVWAFIHILFLIDFQNKFSVMFQWMWHYFTKKRSARLILEDEALLPTESQGKSRLA